MASTHIHFNDQTQYGRMLRRMLDQAEESDDAMPDLLSVMEQMRDGDGSQAVHYAEVTSRFGFASDDKAKAAYDELASAWSKTKEDTLDVQTSSIEDLGGGMSRVTTSTRAARDQLFARLRG